MSSSKFLATAAVAFSTILAGAMPGQSQEDLKHRKEHKLAAEFLKKATWFTDYDAARGAARKQDKVIFAYFTRSYAG